jgi:signal transduction histidine kinase
VLPGSAPAPPAGLDALAAVPTVPSTVTDAVGAAGITFAEELSVYVVLSLAAGVVAVVFVGVMRRWGRGPGTLALTTLALGAAWWSLLYGLELAGATLATKLLFGRLSYLGIVVVPVSWLAFALSYTGRGDRLTPSTVGLLSVPSVLAAVLPWTSGSNDLFWASTSLAPIDGGLVLAVEYGPAFWLWSAYSYALIVAGTILLLGSIPSEGRLFRRQTALLAVGATSPLVANLVYLSRIGPVDTTPLGFVVSALALGAGLQRYRLFDVHPVARGVARDELVERMDESLVVLNEGGRIVDLNRSARSVLDVGGEDIVGASLDAVAHPLAAAVERASDEGAEFTTGDPPRHYEVRVSELNGNSGGTVGRLVTLRDVTERRRREQRLTILNRVLRHDLNNDVTLIEGYAKLLLREPGNEEYAATIARKADEMLELVRTVREVERTLDSGGPTRSTVDVTRVVETQVEAARRAHPRATVETDLPASARVRTTSLVSSVVDNLIENAIVHGDAEAPHVRVSVARVVEDGRPCVELRVADDGPGIPRADRAVLVGDDDARLEDAGGLGLWLVHWLVSESGGEIAYEPNEPRGSVVVLLFPPVETGDGERDDRRPSPDHVPDRVPSRVPRSSTSSSSSSSSPASATT